MRPDRIVVGGIRGGEALDMLTATTTACGGRGASGEQGPGVGGQDDRAGQGQPDWSSQWRVRLVFLVLVGPRVRPTGLSHVVAASSPTRGDGTPAHGVLGARRRGRPRERAGARDAHRLSRDRREANGGELLLKAIAIWATNIVVFGLWFWQLDRGGPVRRADPDPQPPDFQFPQMDSAGRAVRGWSPRLVDCVSCCSRTRWRFSPTDAMPLTRGVRVLMLTEAGVSALTILLVATRAVNILA